MVWRPVRFFCSLLTMLTGHSLSRRDITEHCSGPMSYVIFCIDDRPVVRDMISIQIVFTSYMHTHGSQSFSSLFARQILFRFLWCIPMQCVYYTLTMGQDMQMSSSITFTLSMHLAWCYRPSQCSNILKTFIHPWTLGSFDECLP